MADGLLSGLEAFGFSGLEDMNLFEEEKKAEEGGEAAVTEKKEPQFTEKDFLLDRTYECPICESKFKSRAIKTSSAKLVGTDADLRPRHEYIDVTKYDAVMCPMCGYTALTKFFSQVYGVQKQKIREKICMNFKPHPGAPEVYSYDEAIERFKMALLNAVVKGAKSGEKAYICLKTAWLYRGKAESVGEASPEYKKLKANELEFLKNAYEGFVQAVSTENFPICGMDELTVDYIIATLAFSTDNIEMCKRMNTKVLTSNTASNRVKDKARDLRDELVKKLKSQ